MAATTSTGTLSLRAAVGTARGEIPPLNLRLYKALGDKHPELRTKAAVDLRQSIDSEVRDLTPELCGKYLDSVTGRVLELVNSADINEKLGGIAAIDELIELKCESNETMMVRFANCFRQMFRLATSTTDPLVLEMAAKAHGHLLRVATALMGGDLIEWDLQQALDPWMKADRCRLAAVLVLKELAYNTPTLFNVYVAQFLKVIWMGLCDPKPQIREGAVEALRACLIDMSKRADKYRLECYYSLYEEAKKNILRAKHSYHIHGSLLVIGELLQHTGEFMVPRFEEVAANILRYKSHSNHTISRTVVRLLPRLAALSSAEFIAKYLTQCVEHLIVVLNTASGKHDNRDVAFPALGDIALAVGDAMTPHLGVIIDNLHRGLAKRKDAATADLATASRRKKAAQTALTCVGSLAKAMGPRLYPHMDTLVDQMFLTGLSQTLIDALSEVAYNIPMLMPTIQDRLLDAISAILNLLFVTTIPPSDKPEKIPPYGCPTTPYLPNVPRKLHSVADRKRVRGVETKSENALVVLALKTLGTFNFDTQSQQLICLVRDSVLCFLDYEQVAIRKEAAVTCCKLIPKFAESVRYGQTTLMIFEMLRRLVVVGIADSVWQIRLQVLSSLDARLDKYLAQTEILQTLFVALNDEVFSIREVAITLLGRLSSRNPALIMPSLRKTLIQLLAELQQFTSDTKDQEESSKLLGHLIGSSHQLIKPYVAPILNVLVPKLTDIDNNGTNNKWKDAPSSSRHHSNGVASSVLSTLGKLSMICGEDMIRYLDGLIPLIIGTLQDKASSIKRQVALRTLGQLVSSTGYVIEPCIKYPTLLPTVLNVLKGERSTALRIEVMKVLGVIGALDPYKYRATQGQSYNKSNRGAAAAAAAAAAGGAGNTDEKRNATGGGAVGGTLGARTAPAAAAAAGGDGDGKEGGLNANDNNVSMVQATEDYYPTVAIASLMRVLRDPGLSANHTMVIKAVMFIFKSLGLKCVPFLPQIIPPFLREMRTCDESLRETFFQVFWQIVAIVKQHVRQYLDGIFELVIEYWDKEHLLAHILTLVEEMSLALPDQFKTHLAELIPKLLGILNGDKSEKREPTLRVLHAIQTFASKGALDDYLYVILPGLVRLCEQVEEPINVRVDAVMTISKIARMHDISDHASRVIHPFTRVLSGPSPQLHVECLNVICVLIKQLGVNFAVFEPMVTKVIASNKVETKSNVYSKYTRLVVRVNQRVAALKAQFRVTSPNGVGSPTGNGSVSPSMGPEDDANDGKALAYQQGLDDIDDMNGDEKVDRSTLLSGSSSAAGGDEKAESGPPKKLHVSQENLQKAWSASQRSTKEDWMAWMRGLSIELLKESPSSALRACSALAQKHPPLARELFNAAFLSCWTELYDEKQDNLIASLEGIFQAETPIPPEIMQTLLNLCEFMEHHDKALPIRISTLGNLAQKCHAYAKALHYKETEFHTSPSETIQDLITINNKLQQPDAARGILKFAQRHHSVELKESWYEKLERWEDALEAYERKQLEEPTNSDCTLGRMRCLRSLGEWQRLMHLSNDLWMRKEDAATRKQIAPLAASAAINLRRWDYLERYVSVIEENRVQGNFYRAVLNVHRGHYSAARRYIDRACELLDTNLTALVGESYGRAYQSIVRLQQLMELTEVIQYKSGSEEKKTLIRRMWAERLKGCKRNVEVWQQILSVRSLVTGPREDIDTWLEFSSLCRKNGRLHLSLRILTQLVGRNPSELVTRLDTKLPSDYPQMTLSCLKHLYSAGYPKEAFTRLQELVSSDAMNPDAKRNDGLSPRTIAELKARCYLKLGAWQLGFMEDVESKSTTTESKSNMEMGRTADYQSLIPKVLEYFNAATVCDGQSYKAWHEWAVMNFRVVSHYTTLGGSTKGGKGPNVSSHIVPAIQGFFRAILLQRASDNSRQDVLRLLALWFAHGARKDVEAALVQGINAISLDNWLAVIPQMIARINTPHPSVRKLLHDLLCKIGRAHPQALVYPLTVSSKAQAESRKAASLNVLNNMRMHSAALVDQAMLVSQELVRVAILWHELWHEGIEEASRFWFGQKNAEGMLATLAPLHAMMDKGPQTMREVAFQQVFGRALQEAQEMTKKYVKSRSVTWLQKAWELYSDVFRKMSKQLQALTDLELHDVSPKLLSSRDLQLAVPGTYRANQPIVRIGHFSPSMRVIESKQHPRKLTLSGSDGVEYAFLLKGHEDLRQDERVMQLFGLVNTLLANDRNTAKSDLSIHRYSVIPLSPNSGLIEWVPFTDTVHAVIKQYRDARKIMLNIEQRLMLKMAPDYQLLTLIQKVEVFEYALSMTTGQDLCKVLWLKSPSAEVWLDRRSNYTRSLAVMSMVGYILGLGDRHPCNLMVDRNSGKIIHIDFGDCFEVAMHRDKYPEKVPFRLTRMLVNAMEVSGIEGTFRSTCESVMRVLRKNQNSVMAVLEAFVYDPLINWRLLETKRKRKEVKDDDGKERRASDLDDTTTASGIGTAGGVGPLLVKTGSGVSHHHGVIRPGSRPDSVVVRAGDPPQPSSRVPAGAVTASGVAGESKESKDPSVTAEEEKMGEPIEALNEKALAIISRVESKLKGKDFLNDAGNPTTLDVPAQVQKLIVEATSHLNLCQSYIGWCPFW